MKVLTYKKLLEKIAEENTYHARVQAIEDEASDKVAKFLEELKRYGDNIKYYKDIDTGRIKGGYMEKNEVMYDFEINDNGYIRQEVKLRSRIGENCLEAFDKLSDNKYNG